MQRLFFGKSDRSLLQTAPQCSCSVGPSTCTPSSNCLKFMSRKGSADQPSAVCGSEQTGGLSFLANFSFLWALLKWIFPKIITCDYFKDILCLALHHAKQGQVFALCFSFLCNLHMLWWCLKFRSYGTSKQSLGCINSTTEDPYTYPSYVDGSDRHLQQEAVGFILPFGCFTGLVINA